MHDSRTCGRGHVRRHVLDVCVDVGMIRSIETSAGACADLRVGIGMGMCTALSEDVHVV